MWFLCLQQFCRAAGYIFFASWFATYLQEARGVTILNSGWLTTLPLIADVTGCLFGGFSPTGSCEYRATPPSRRRQGLAVVALLLCSGSSRPLFHRPSRPRRARHQCRMFYYAATANPILSATVIVAGWSPRRHRQRHGQHERQPRRRRLPHRRALAARKCGRVECVLAGFASLYVIAAVFWFLIRRRGVCSRGRGDGEKSTIPQILTHGLQIIRCNRIICTMWIDRWMEPVVLDRAKTLPVVVLTEPGRPGKPRW